MSKKTKMYKRSHIRDRKRQERKDGKKQTRKEAFNAKMLELQEAAAIDRI